MSGKFLPVVLVGSALSGALAPTVFGQATAASPSQPPATTAAGAPAKPLTIELKMEPGLFDMDFIKKHEQGYAPWTLAVSPEKPAAIVKEPGYAGKPLYGAVRMGNGPKNLTYCVIDEPAAEDVPQKIYVDTNQNGDLTDDGPGLWDSVKKPATGPTWYETTVEVHGSWGTPLKEELGSPCKLYVYRRGTGVTCYFSMAARSGSMTLGDKSYNIVLRDDGNDGLFYVTANNDRNHPTPTLLVDLDGDGTFKGFKQKDGENEVKVSERFSLNVPFKLGDQWWYASPTLSGNKLTLTPTSEPSDGKPAIPEAERAPLLAAGTVAPDFSAVGETGKPVKLSDFKGKVVILDFWATWCGPCQVSMPKLQETYNKVRDQGVVVLSVCVWDEKPLFDAYMKEKSGKVYNFTFGFDPKGRDEGNIAQSLYNVSGIPTMYVIDRDGKVSAGLLGGGQEKPLAEALKKLNIKVPE